MSNSTDGGDAVDRMLNEIEILLKRQQDGAPVRQAAKRTLEATMDDDRLAQGPEESDAVRPPHDGSEPIRMRDLLGESGDDESPTQHADNDPEQGGDGDGAAPSGSEDAANEAADPSRAAADYDPDESIELEPYDPEEVVREIRELKSREALADADDTLEEPVDDDTPADGADGDEPTLDVSPSEGDEEEATSEASDFDPDATPRNLDAYDPDATPPPSDAYDPDATVPHGEAVDARTKADDGEAIEESDDDEPSAAKDDDELSAAKDDGEPSVAKGDGEPSVAKGDGEPSAKDDGEPSEGPGAPTADETSGRPEPQIELRPQEDDAPSPPRPALEPQYDLAPADEHDEVVSPRTLADLETTEPDGGVAVGPDPSAAPRRRPKLEDEHDGTHMTRRLTTRLGQLLVDADMISEQQLGAALRRQRETGDRLGAVLVNEGYIDEPTLLSVLQSQYGVPAVRLDEIELDAGLAKLIPHDLARRNLIVPLAMRADAVDVAMVDPTDFVAMAHVRFAAGVRPNVFITTVNAARRAIARLYGEEVVEEATDDDLAPREAIKRMILERDAVLLGAEQDPRKFYELAASIEKFVDEIMRKARGNE